MENIAEAIITRLGGHKQVAEILGLSPTQIYRFTYEKNKGGTGGTIPAKYIPVLAGLKDTRGRKIKHADFFPRPVT